MKKLLQSGLLFLTTFLFSTMSWGQITENFDTGLSGSYTTGSQTLNSGVWTTANVLQESSSDARSGFAARLNDNMPESSLTTPEINSGVGEISFWYRELNSGGGTFKVQVSSDGTNFSDVDSQTYSGSTYSQYIYTLNQSGTVYIKILIENQEGHLIIDDFSTTAFTATTTETINLSETTLSGLDYVDGNGPSTEQTFTAEGSNLTADITVTAPTNFEISTTSGSGFGSSVTLTETSGSVSSTPIYVRLASGLAVDTYSGTLSATSTGATQQDVSLSGEVSAATCAGTSTSFPFNGVTGSTNLEHSSSNPPGSSGEDCGTNYLIYYDTAPSTDSSVNFLRSNTTDDLIESADWGGEGKFETFAIDVSGETSVDIETFGNTTNSGFNAGGEEFQWWYTLDGGTQINLGSAISGTGSLAVGPTTIDVTAVNEIIVGFTFNMNGGSDGFEDVDVTVTATPTAPEVGFDSASSTVNETNATFTINIPVTLSNFSSNVDLSVSVDGSSTAEASDYTLNTTSLSFTGNGTQNISLDINPDAGYDDETIILEIAETTSTGVTITTSQHTVTVLDDETAPLGWQITAEDTDFVIDFDNTVAGVNNGQFNGSGFSPSPATGQLNSEAWKTTGMSDGDSNFGDTETSGDFARGPSTGGETTGGFYAFETSSNNLSLGFQGAGSDFTPGTITLRAQNQTGTTVTDVDLSYILYVYNDQDRANSFNFEYSTDGSNYTTVASLDFTSQEVADGSPVWASNSKSTSISNLSIADGAYFYLRWESDDVSVSGSRDELAIDDITINFNPVIYIYDNGWNTNPVVASTAANDIKVINGTANITQELVANNLEIALGATLNISPSGVLDLAGDITNNGDLVFQSDENGTAQLAEFTGSITGDVTVERYIPAKRAFRLLSSAVGGESIANTWQQDTHITGTGGATNGFDVTGTNNPSMFTFDNTITDQTSGAGWQATANTNVTNLEAGTPYRLMVRGDLSIDLTDNDAPANDVTLSASGTMHTGSFTPTLATAANNYSFVGNPYQAVVDFGAVTTTNLTGYLYVWDASIAGDNGRGGYTVVDAADGSEVTGISPHSSAANQYIMPGQAFFVQNNGTGNGSITFEEVDKATAQSQVSIFSEYTNFYINSRLYKASALQNGEMESDAIGLRFNEQYTTIGSEEDASKLANPGENYAIVNNGFKSIDKQNIPTDGHQVDLLIVNYEENAYSLSFTLGNQPEALKVYLNDSYLATQTELTESTTYNFTVDANVPESIDQNRFHLSFETVALGQQDFTEVQVRLYPNPVVDELQIELPASVLVNSVKIFNLLGQEVIASTRPQVDVRLLSSGFYLVQVDTSAGTVTKKIIKK
ncbi:T9SS type A sorting domain-containing protein [Psychroflexus maritimus]|uniref:T9SS type A sorting domain-containing protein n=1 Tax=Psychroflexus maritimus TaxID=2714865 RepID=A0A967ABV5_9FLAO|nr:T9SS type A sorting domain-containing protein [Psychroflexus maritimus]NGZ89409.1 T9SS type A sorting domain-containing protein [Psychroflexus maritimus]